MLLTWCGTALAAPVNTVGLWVDINGGNGPTETGLPFQGWNIANPPGANSFTQTFTFTNGNPVAVVMTSQSSNGQAAGSRNRGGLANQAWANLLNDFFFCPHNGSIGYGADYVEFDFSGLLRQYKL